MKSATIKVDKSIAAPQLIAVINLFNSFPVRLLGTLIIAVPMSLLISSAIYPLCVPYLAENLADQIATEMGQQTTSAYRNLNIITEHDLAWCYVTANDGSVIPITRSFAPSLSKYPQASGELVVQHKKYYESVLRMNADESLHVALPLDQVWDLFDDVLDLSKLVWLRPIRLGVVVVTALFMFVVIISLVEICFRFPLRLLIESIDQPSRLRQLSVASNFVSEIRDLVSAVKRFNAQEIKAKQLENTSRRPNSKKFDTKSMSATPPQPILIFNETPSVPNANLFDYELDSAQNTRLFKHENLARRILHIPINANDAELASIVMFMPDDEQITAEQLRSLQRFRDQTSTFFHKLILREGSEESDWTDHLTGLRNRQFFQELMINVLEKSKRLQRRPFSILVLNIDSSEANLEHRDTDTSDRYARELARILTASMTFTTRIETNTDPQNYLVRYQADEFALVLEACAETKATEIAEKIKAAVEADQGWAGAGKTVTVSVGCATYPRNANNTEELVAKARKALFYSNEHLGSNRVCHINDVPDIFKPSRRGSAFSGELGVLDCSGLLQSIAGTQKTGLLTVQADNGKTLLLTWEKGKPKFAKLGQLCGVQAIIEFIVTFETGTFSFQKRTSSSLENAGSEIFDSLERVLIEGALAEDHVISAKRLIPNMDLIVRAVPGIDNAYRWLRLKEDREITKDELAAMHKLIKLADGTRSLTKIFDETDQTPHYIVWRAAGLLVENRLLQVKRV